MVGLPAAWLLVGGALVAALEVLTPGAMLIWIGAALMGTGLATLLLGLDASGQTLAFVLLLGAGVAGGLFLRKASPPADLVANLPDAGLAGRTGRTDVLFEGGRGRVRLGDTHWNARALDGADLPAGLLVRVHRVEDGVLVVAAAGPFRGDDANSLQTPDAAAYDDGGGGDGGDGA
jgi:membrane protein implicated in regulation of membrane protease activity